MYKCVVCGDDYANAFLSPSGVTCGSGGCEDEWVSVMRLHLDPPRSGVPFAHANFWCRYCGYSINFAVSPDCLSMRAEGERFAWDHFERHHRESRGTLPF